MLSKYATHDNSAYPGLWRGCVGAWCPSLGPSGGKLYDYSRRGNFGTVTNATLADVYAVNRGQYCVDLDGTDDRVDCSQDVAFLRPATRGAVSVWCNLDAFAATNMIFSMNATAATGLSTVAIYVNGDAGVNNIWMIAYLTNSGYYNNPANNSVIAAGTWYHILFCQDGAGPYIYLNGVRRNTDAGPVSGGTTNTSWFSLLTNAADVSWGDYVSNGSRAGRWNGKLDDMRIYNRVPSAAEAALLASRRGIAFTPRTRRLSPSEQAAATNRRRRIICGANC